MLLKCVENKRKIRDQSILMLPSLLQAIKPVGILIHSWLSKKSFCSWKKTLNTWCSFLTSIVYSFNWTKITLLLKSLFASCPNTKFSIHFCLENVFCTVSMVDIILVNSDIMYSMSFSTVPVANAYFSM